MEVIVRRLKCQHVSKHYLFKSYFNTEVIWKGSNDAPYILK